MPRYTAKLSDGRTVTLEADSQPSEDDILKAVEEYKTPSPAPAAPPAEEAPPAYDAAKAMGIGMKGLPEGTSTPLANLSALAHTAKAASEIPSPLHLPRPFPRQFRISDKGIEMVPDTYLKTIAREGASMAESIPEFLTSPMGAATVLGGGVAPKLTAAGLSALGLKATYDTLKAESEGYEQKTGPEKAASIMRVTGAGAMAYFPARAAIPGIITGAARFLPKAAQEAAKDVGDQTSPPAPQTPQAEPASPQSPLSEEDARYLRAEQEGMSTPVDIVPEPTDENVPFARRRLAGQFMGINRQTGRIEVYPEEFSRWLKTVPEKRRAQAVRSRLGEEEFHLKTSDQDAQTYWDTLSFPEKAIAERIYTGKWGGRKYYKGLNDLDLGHEAIRMRMQRMARMSLSESAEAALKERWSVQSLDALSNTIRTIRESIKNPTPEQTAMLDRMTANAAAAARAAAGGATPARSQSATDVAKMSPQQVVDWKKSTSYGPDTPAQLAKSLSADDVSALESERDRLRKEVESDMAQASPETADKIWAQTGPKSLKAQTLNEIIDASKSQPAAIRKGAGKETPGFFLPDVPRGTEVERGVYAKPDQAAVNSMAEHHFNDSTLNTRRIITATPEGPDVESIQTREVRPDFDRFLGELKSRFGSGVSRDQAWYAWTDAMYNRLMNAPGAEVEDMINALGLKGKLQAEHQVSFGRGTIPDKFNFDWDALRNLSKRARRKELTAAEARRFSPEQRRRFSAVSAIADKLLKEAGDAPDKPLDRTDVGPEDVSQIMGQSQWKTLTPKEANDLPTLRTIATTGAGVHAEGKGAPPRSVSRMLIAATNPSGQVNLLSSWKDPRRGAVITNPSSTGDKSIPIDSEFLRNNRPIAAIPIREPVQHFRQTFPDREAFAKHFGDIGIEGTPGIKTSSFVGPEAGITEFLAGIKRSAGRPLLGKAALPPSISGGPPESVVRKGFSNPQLAEGLQKLFGEQYQQLAAEQPKPKPSTARDLMMPRFARRTIPSEDLPPQAVPPSPEPSRFLSPEDQEYVKRQAWEKYPSKDDPYQGGSPAAINKQLADDLSAIADSFKYGVLNRKTRDLIARDFDDASNRPHNIARRIENGIRLLSAEYKGILGKIQKLGAEIPGNKDVLSAANAVVQAGFDRSKIPDFKAQVAQGKAEAAKLLASASWRDRRIGRVWDRAADELDKELDYAEAHWDDPELKATSSRMALQLENMRKALKNAGYKVNRAENYLPGRYDMSAWNGDFAFFKMPKVWGTKWRQPKVFKNYYEAISKGPYVAATRDGASLVGHAARKALDMISRGKWHESLKAMNGPTGDPIAVDSKYNKKTHTFVPGREGYEDIDMGGKHLSVHEDFAPIIRQLTGRNMIEDWAPSRIALHFEQVLKHNLLLGDFFHFGRMAYYAASIMGRAAGWRKGWSAIDIEPRDVKEAVNRGVITQAEADWADHKVNFNGSMITRRDLLNEATGNKVGFNIGQIQDALYKDLFTKGTPTSGPVKKAFAAITDPTTGRYNRFLFDRFSRGLMAESLVNEFEKQSAKLPGLKTVKTKTGTMTTGTDHVHLLRDISRDLNNYYGNLGRQGIFKAKWQQDLSRMLLLAPQWVEGLVNKELVGYSRLSGISKLTGQRRGLTALGTTGSAMGKGLASMFILTQGLNLITRGHPTWDNQEKGHKFDAWIPSGGGREEGFWLSPMATFNELSHDLYRLTESKPTVMDAVSQIAGNKQSPILRALLIAKTGQLPSGEISTTSGSRLEGAGSALLPVPISFGKGLRAIGHAVAPGLVDPNAPGQLARQAMSSFGFKLEPQASVLSEVGNMAKDFLVKEGLNSETGWRQQMTDEPGYSKLRQALREGNERAARVNLAALRKTRTDKQILQSMKNWSKRPFTGTKKNERLFLDSLSDPELNKYDQAQDRRQREYEAFLDWYMRQP